MKKYIYLALITLSVIACKDLKYDYNLKQMGQALNEHFKQKDLDNSTVTNITLLKPISYEKIAENKRLQPDEMYLTKIYVKGTWSYMDSNRIYNMDDTLSCFFNEDLSLLRVETNEKQ